MFVELFSTTLATGRRMTVSGARTTSTFGKGGDSRDTERMLTAKADYEREAKNLPIH